MAVIDLDPTQRHEGNLSPEQQGFREHIVRNIAQYSRIFEDYPEPLFSASSEDISHPVVRALHAMDIVIGTPNPPSAVVLELGNPNDLVGTQLREEFLRALGVGHEASQGRPDAEDRSSKTSASKFRILKQLFGRHMLVEEAVHERGTRELLSLRYALVTAGQTK